MSAWLFFVRIQSATWGSLTLSHSRIYFLPADFRCICSIQAFKHNLANRTSMHVQLYFLKFFIRKAQNERAFYFYKESDSVFKVPNIYLIMLFIFSNCCMNLNCVYLLPYFMLPGLVLPFTHSINYNHCTLLIIVTLFFHELLPASFLTTILLTVFTRC